MRAVDTDILVRLLEQDDTVQAAATRAYQQSGGPLWVSHIVLVETIWVLSSTFRRTRREILGVLEALLGNADIHLQEEALVSLAVTAFRETRAEFSDCLVLAAARASGHLPLATFDKNLLKLPDTTQPKAPSH